MYAGKRVGFEIWVQKEELKFISSSVRLVFVVSDNNINNNNFKLIKLCKVAASTLVSEH